VKVNLDSIPAAGRKVSFTHERAWASEAAALALEGPATSMNGDLRLSTEGAHIRVRGTLEATTDLRCHRCSSPVTIVLSGEVDLGYAPAGEALVLDEDVELEAAELDQGWYSGGRLDMVQVLSEQLALWLPERIRCEDPGVMRHGEGTCALPTAHEGPAPGRQRPFANLRLPE